MVGLLVHERVDAAGGTENAVEQLPDNRRALIFTIGQAAPATLKALRILVCPQPRPVPVAGSAAWYVRGRVGHAAGQHRRFFRLSAVRGVTNNLLAFHRQQIWDCALCEREVALGRVSGGAMAIKVLA